MGLGESFKKVLIIGLAATFITVAADGEALAKKRKISRKAARAIAAECARLAKRGRKLPKKCRPKGPAMGPDAAHLLIKLDGTILAEKNPDSREEPASITKLMMTTASLDRRKKDSEEAAQKLVQQNPGLSIEDARKQAKRSILNRPVEISLEDVRRVRKAKCLSTEPGKTITEESLLILTATKSCNDFASKYASEVFGSDEEAVREMNALAQKLGMTSTHWANTSGLSPKSTPLLEENGVNRTTARDLAKLLKYLWENHQENFHYLSMKKAYNPLKDEFVNNTNPLVHGTEAKQGFEVLLSKTGTFPGDSSVVMIVRKNNEILLYVTMDNPSGAARAKNAKKEINEGYSKSRTSQVRYTSLPLKSTPRQPFGDHQPPEPR